MVPTRCLLLVLWLGVSMPVFAVDEKTCDQHRDALVDSLASEREAMLAKVERALNESGDEREKEYLRSRREQIWDDEEQRRAVAEQIWRDCSRHFRSLQ
jgi:hypothetical protein